MGSLGPSTQVPPHSNQDLHNEYRVYTSFSTKYRMPNINVSNWIECYNPSDNTWARVTSIPTLIENHVLKGFAMVSMEDDIYVIGGRLCHKEVLGGPHDFLEMDLEVRGAVLKYDVSTGIWSKCASLGVPRYDFACAVIGDKIYVAGGKCNIDSMRGISSSEVYDPALDQWKSLPNMTTSRYKCVGVMWQGKFYVIGGFVDKGDNNSQGPYMMERSSAEVYDTSADTWDFRAMMWQLDVPPNQIVSIGPKLFSSGDCFKKWKGYIEAYDGKQNMWNEVEGSDFHTLSSPVSILDDIWPPTEQLYLTMAPIGTRLYFLAGYRMAGEIAKFKSEVHVFDTSENGDGWRSFHEVVEEGEKELCCHGCVVKLAS